MDKIQTLFLKDGKNNLFLKAMKFNEKTNNLNFTKFLDMDG